MGGREGETYYLTKSEARSDGCIFYSRDEYFAETDAILGPKKKKTRSRLNSSCEWYGPPSLCPAYGNTADQILSKLK